MEEQNHEQVDFYSALIKKTKKEHARCSKWCTYWNSYDRDCEIMGINHRTPSTCPLFWQSCYNDFKNGRFKL